MVGATSVVRWARTAETTAANWIRSLLERRPARLVTVAMANKTARIVWAVLRTGKPMLACRNLRIIAAHMRSLRRTVRVPIEVMMTI